MTPTRAIKVSPGKRFNRLEILGEQFPIRQYGKRLQFVVCKCDCGAVVVAQLSKLTSGHTKSCGCLHLEILCEKRLKHGESATRLYVIWRRMRSRCKERFGKTFEKYRGRGVSVCREWDSFENFKKWAIQSGYQNGLTIDRRHSNGNYDPENCRWVNEVRQSQNRRKITRPASSRFKGVSLQSGTNRWAARIRVFGQSIALGNFKSEQEAAEAYDSAARIQFGEFACLNFPRPGESAALPAASEWQKMGAV